MGDLSLHFSLSEFACHDGTPVPAAYYPNVRRLALLVLETIRFEVGCPIIVLSGYRTAKHNHDVGGAPNSLHLTASAADIWAPEYDTGDTKLWALVRGVWQRGHLPALGGLGRYPNRLHVDCRPHAPGDPIIEWDNSVTHERG